MPVSESGRSLYAQAHQGFKTGPRPYWNQLPSALQLSWAGLNPSSRTSCETARVEA